MINKLRNILDSLNTNAAVDWSLIFASVVLLALVTPVVMQAF